MFFLFETNDGGSWSVPFWLRHVEPLRQGRCWQVSKRGEAQRGPVTSSGHTHEKPPGSSWQVPPFSQGDEAHSLMSMSHL